MQSLLAELRGLWAATGVSQVEIAKRMGMRADVLNRILRGKTTTIPADFEPRFRQAVADIAAEEAQRTVEAAEARARAIREAAGIPA